MKAGDLIKFAIIGVIGYVGYNYLVSSGLWAQWFGGASGGTTPALPAGGGAVMSVTTAGGNPAALKAGEAWTVKITGAPPNAHVDATDYQQNGVTIPNSIGNAMTDSSGTFSYASTAPVASNYMGNWSTVWTVNGQQIGTWNFTLSAAGVSGVDNDALRNQLAAAGVQFMRAMNAPGLSADQWAFYYQQLTGTSLTESQAQNIVMNTGMQRGSLITLDQFLNALHGAGLGAIIEVPNAGPISAPLPTVSQNFSKTGGYGGYSGGGYRKGNGYVQ